MMLLILLPGAVSASPTPPSSADGGWRHTKNRLAGPSDPSALLESEEAWTRGAHDERLRLLESALKEGIFEDIVRLELAEMILGEDPERSVQLISPLLRSAPTDEMKAGALEILESAANFGLDPDRLREVRKISHLSRSFRRRLDVLTAEPDTSSGRRILLRAISKTNYDLPSLRAAEKLLQLKDLSASEKLSIAEVLYRHALYSRARPILEELSSHPGRRLRLSKVRYLLGRCHFRMGDYAAARSWYLKALETTSAKEERASLQVHIARCFELEGDLNQAILHARSAVLSRGSDPRKLFLARLRLRTHRPDLAALGISRIRSSSRRSRGALLMALFSMAKKDSPEALRHLREVSSPSWTGAASILEAEIQLERGKAAEALKILRRHAFRLDPFWTWRARLLMEKLPAEIVKDWREDLRRRSRESSAAGERGLREWAILEFEDSGRKEVRRRLAVERPSSPEAQPEKIRGIAGKLHRVGLRRLAMRWDPGSYPAGSAAESLWSATQAREFPRPAILLADHAWRQWGSEIPSDCADPRLMEVLYPLPHPEDLAQAVSGYHFLQEPLLAAIAREESRWDPHALSAVGARGLLQLMPATALAAAAREGLTPPRASDLFRRRLNLRLGASELEKLLRKFDGFRPSAIAAYNAGTDQAELWRLQCGEECSVEKYVLMIGFDATRSYTADVLLAESIYELKVRNARLRETSAPRPATAESGR